MTAPRDPTVQRAATPDPATTGMEGTRVAGTLLAPEESVRYLYSWDEIQATFIDDPQASVAAADTLVQEVIADIVRSFHAERERLEQRWREEEEVSTEDLRRALQRYRTFFTRLLET